MANTRTTRRTPRSSNPGTIPAPTGWMARLRQSVSDLGQPYLKADTARFIAGFALLAVSIFKVIIGTLLGITVGPLVGAIYTFLVSNIVGKQISRAAVTTLILTAAVYALNYFNIVTIAFSSLFLSAFLPALLVLLILWYLLNKFL